MRRVAGIDLGKATVELAVFTVDDEGVARLETRAALAHEGEPTAAFERLYREHHLERCAAISATGVYADELRAPVRALPERACVEAALAYADGLPAALNLVQIGARGYSVLSRDEKGRVRFLENDKCSSGTGETMVKIAGRFGLSVQEADRIAQSADEAIPITARCSVFAKSEMTHFGNAGRPADALFRGYFGSVASYVAALLERVRVEGPIVVIGGPARLGSLVAALGEASGLPVIVPDDAQGFEAVGAGRLAVEELDGRDAPTLPIDPAALLRPRERRIHSLPAARAHAHRVRRLEAPAIAAGADREPTVLGLDLGSTGSKAVLTSIATGEAVLDVYDRTQGNPVEAAGRLIERILALTTPDVRAIGLTGSGREAVATVMRAAYAELADRIVVQNEIVAHATAAIRCDDEGGRSLSVVEIGGQDAKFIQIVEGQIVESDMNRACSAGTGSFLEEQSVFHGVHDIEEFTELASQAERPPDLGQMCTVFVADAAAEAAGEGFGIPDIFGGFQYSVIHNYKNRVMGQRTFGERIFFQGKPATGASLSWTLAAVTGRDVIVPPNPGAMGAWGIGLCLQKEISAPVLLAASPFDLRAALGARVVGQTEFQCRDKQCATLCNIQKTAIEVAGARRNVLSGGACPKYEISTARSQKLPLGTPSAFDEREALLAPYLVPDENDGAFGVPRVGTCEGLIPWLVTLLRELDVPVRVMSPDKGSLVRGEARCHSFDACAPAKIAHGVADGDLDRIFFPKILSVPDRDGESGGCCTMEQALPDLCREALKSRGREVDVVHPTLDLSAGYTSPTVFFSLLYALPKLGAEPERLWRAMACAAREQAAYEEALAEIGDRTLEHARIHDLDVVLVVGSLHVIHDPAVNASIPQLLRENGVLALPMDCLRIEESVHPITRLGWADARRALRSAIAARALGDVYPLMLTSFGCGPSSFAEQVFGALMEGYPHTVLESDGHGGAAGYVTRVQAFLHTVRRHDGAGSAPLAHRLRMLDPLPEGNAKGDAPEETIILRVGDQLPEVVAAVYRAFGLEATASPPSTPESLALGRQDCSGKECLPYQLIWGSFRQELEAEGRNGARASLLTVTGEGRCRNCMFSVKDQLSIERLGLSDRVRVRHLGGGHDEAGFAFRSRQWSGQVAWDLLQQLAAYYRPLEREEGEVDALYERFVARLLEELERPHKTGLGGMLELRRARRRLFDLLDEVGRAFAHLERPADELRTVLLSGDIYVRVDEFAGDKLIRRLNERGLRVLLEPTSAFVEYAAQEGISELVGVPEGFVEGYLHHRAMRDLRRELYARVQAHHPWLPLHDASELIAAARPVLDRHPQSEAPVTIGSVRLHWQQRTCDGVVVVSPWGCAPALVSESILRHQSDVPMLFIYCDGSPIDVRKLNAFAFQRLREPARAVVSAEVARSPV